jgi:ferredoxin
VPLAAKPGAAFGDHRVGEPLDDSLLKERANMPWVNEEMCVSCAVCVDECCADAISMNEGVAFIDDDKCIRCGVCHDVCAEDAIRHDGERIPQEVESNLAWVRGILEHDHYSNSRDKQKELIERMKRYFKKERKVAEKTIEQIDAWEATQYGS